MMKIRVKYACYELNFALMMQNCILYANPWKLVFDPMFDAHAGVMITCIYKLNSYLISLIFMLILCNFDECYLNFMNFLHWNAILLKCIFMYKLGIIICLIDD